MIRLKLVGQGRPQALVIIRPYFSAGFGVPYDARDLIIENQQLLKADSSESQPEHKLSNPSLLCRAQEVEIGPSYIQVR
jgi:hypothetical protein